MEVKVYHGGGDGMIEVAGRALWSQSSQIMIYGLVRITHLADVGERLGRIEFPCEAVHVYHWHADFSCASREIPIRDHVVVEPNESVQEFEGGVGEVHDIMIYQLWWQ